MSQRQSSQNFSASGHLWRVDVSISPDAEEAVLALMESILGHWPSVYQDLELHKTIVTAYLGSSREWTKARQQTLRDGLNRIREAGLETGRVRVRAAKMARENWAESWKRHFHPLLVADRLLIKPTWSRRKARRDQEVILIDPGLSFGTGHHPTTRFCLGQLVEFQNSNKKEGPSFLDVGCGSGILSIAAAKLGYRPVEGFDNDPAAVRVARENADLNGVGVGAGFKLVKRDVATLGRLKERVFDVVCANLIENLLVGNRDVISRRVAKGGILVLAGILNEQFSGVERNYVKAGWKLRDKVTEGEWTSGSFISV